MAVPADWYLDPTNRNERRYWDGSRWTERVIDVNGKESVDPLVAGSARVDLADWASSAASSDTAGARQSQGTGGGSTVTRRKVAGPPSDRHKVVIGSSMLSGSLALAIAGLVLAFIVPLGPVAVVFGLVSVWFSLRGRSLIRGAGDLEVVGPSRNLLLGTLAALVGVISSALFVAMLRGGDVTWYAMCVSRGHGGCWSDLVRAAASRLGL